VALVASGQQQPLPVVGYIDVRPARYKPSFYQGLNELGFVDRGNVMVDYREVSEIDQLPAIAVDMARNNVAAIVSATNAIVAAKAVTSTIPLVFIGGTDPVAIGLVATFNHPGGNVTGVRLTAGELPAKQIELLHELVPTAINIGLLISPKFTDQEPQAAVASEAARKIGIAPIIERVTAESDFEPAFIRFQQERVGAVFVVTNVFFGTFADRLAMIALRAGLPLFGQSRTYPAAGGLASYGTSTPDVIRQAGTYVGRILKGEKPAELPVLQPTKFDLVINLKTAKSLGLDVPPSLLARADEVIE
jgi:putative tryptophan/tyrosine transport system substrate-binding protein